jgi:hypothetical protein
MAGALAACHLAQVIVKVEEISTKITQGCGGVFHDQSRSV